MRIIVREIKKRNGEIKEMLYLDGIINGKRIRKSLGKENTKKNMIEAKKEISLILNSQLEENAKIAMSKSMPMIDDYMKHSFKLNEGNRKESTIKAHWQNYNKYIKKEFGDLKLNELTSSAITLWQNNLLNGHMLRAGTIKKVRGLLYTMYADAISEEIINDNPVERVKKLKDIRLNNEPRANLEPFQIEEIESIINAADEFDRNLVATLFYTGMRIGECIGLKWEHIDFKNKQIHIKQQIVEGKITVLKSAGSNRTIPLLETLIPFLQKQFKMTGEDNSFVFKTKKTNKHYHDGGKVSEQIWKKLLEKANVKYRNLHQTRGTFISTLLSNGKDILSVSKIAGHSNSSITFRNYAKYIPQKEENYDACFHKKPQKLI